MREKAGNIFSKVYLKNVPEFILVWFAYVLNLNASWHIFSPAIFLNKFFVFLPSRRNNGRKELQLRLGGIFLRDKPDREGSRKKEGSLCESRQKSAEDNGH